MSAYPTAPNPQQGAGAAGVPGMMWGAQCPAQMACGHMQMPGLVQPGAQGNQPQAYYGMQASAVNPAMMTGGFQMGCYGAQQQQQQQLPTQPPAPVPDASQAAGVAESFRECVEGLSRIEKEYYTYLWHQACSNAGSQVLSGKAAFDFLSRSSVSRETLKRIWDLADYQKRHFLTWEEFAVTMKLICAAQKKQLVSLERIHIRSATSMDCPEFDGFDNVTVFLRAHPELQPAVDENAAPTGGADVFDAFADLAPPPSEPTPPLMPPMPAAVAPVDTSVGMPGMGQMGQASLEGTNMAMQFPPVPNQEMTASIGEAAQQWSTSFDTAIPGMPQPSGGKGADDDDWGDFASPPGATTSQPLGHNLAPPDAATDDEWGGFAAAETSEGAAPKALNAFQEEVEPAGFAAWTNGVDSEQVSGAKASPGLPSKPNWGALDALTDALTTDEFTWNGSADVDPSPPAQAVEDDSWAAFGNDDFVSSSASQAPTGTAPSFPSQEKAPIVPDAGESWAPSFETNFAQQGGNEADNGDWGDFSSQPGAASSTAFVSAPVLGGFDGDAENEWGGLATANAATTNARDEGAIRMDAFQEEAELGRVQGLPKPDWGAFDGLGGEKDLTDFTAAWNDGADGETAMAGQSAPVVQEDESWAAFGNDDFVSSAPSLTAFQTSPTKAVSSTALPTPPPPPLQVSGDMFNGSTSFSQAPTGPETEHQKLARSLVRLGLFEQAMRCAEYGKKKEELESAEARKKEAVARDDFEGAISIRSEIQRLSAELGSSSQVEAWRQAVERDERDHTLHTAMQHIRQQCKMLDKAASSKALHIALSNVRAPQEFFGDFSELPNLVFQHRKAVAMLRAIQTACSSDPWRFLQVLVVCLDSLTTVLNSCCTSLGQLLAMELSSEEKDMVDRAPEFTALLKGVQCLRRLLWRFSLVAEAFAPSQLSIDTSSDADFSEADATELQNMLSQVASKSSSSSESWSRVDQLLRSLQLNVEAWDPQDCFEICRGVSSAEDSHTSSGPLCMLCHLPASPLASFGAAPAGDDNAVSSAFWKGGLWHVQCANFWIKHCPQALKDLSVADPF
mmetsp:Transcript_34540/g.63118  ORF Transcript_34540/g.63118 Transcript_34540/m.63118 type:complete len:1073 (-) Transcript_34540:55-3273(-)